MGVDHAGITFSLIHSGGVLPAIISATPCLRLRAYAPTSGLSDHIANGIEGQGDVGAVAVVGDLAALGHFNQRVEAKGLRV